MRLSRFLLLIALAGSSFDSDSQIVINEIMAANATFLMDEDFYNFPDWLEIYNHGNTNIVLSDYYLSDDINNLMKWQLPWMYIQAGNYHVVYCDKEASGWHSNFGLSADGETVYLTDKSGTIVDQVTYGRQFTDISYGRNPSNLNQWFFCANPTPGSPNMINYGITQSPIAGYSLEAGRLGSSSDLILTGQNISYTVNGAEPNMYASSYLKPIFINRTMVLKSKNEQDGYLPSKTYANTYFLNEHIFTLPVVSVSYTPEYFYDNTYGIYVRGTNGIEGNCTGPANWNQPWERGAYFEYFDEHGIKQISQPVGVKIFGGCSRSFTDQKSLSIYARDKYGDGDFDYSFFKEKPEISRYKSLIIRNSGNDVNATQLRDAFLQALAKQSVDMDYQAYQPAIAYFNGSYMGIMNLREKTDEDYFWSNYALSDDSIDFLEGNLRSGESINYTAIRGTVDDFSDIITFISNNSLASDDNYNAVISKFDFQEYLNYMAVQIYMANTDWPGNNLKFWKKSDNGKWRWMLYDTDFGFGYASYDHPTIDFAAETNGPDWPNPPWSTLLFRKLLENENFQKDFARTILTLRNTTFHPEWCNYVMDSLAAVIEYEIDYHKARWGGTKNDWYGSINGLKNYAAARYNFIPGYVSSYFNLSGNQVVVSVSNPDISKGDVAINESVIMHYPFNMNTFKDLELSVEALPAKGYRFKHWKYASQMLTEYIIDLGSEWSYLDEAGDYPSDWKIISFDDSSWEKGPAQLGYGEGDEATVISYGSDPNNKIPTALFRKKFTLTDTAGMSDIELGLVADDGAIVYLNGQEIFRDNMPAGTVVFNSYASNAIESSFAYAEVDKELLIIGENILACEVHQANGTSSDISFDLSIGYTFKEEGDDGIYSHDMLINSDTSFNIALEPIFEPVDIIQGIYLNEIASTTDFFRDEHGEESGFVELYNNTSEDVTLFSYFLSDDAGNLMRYAIPDSTVIPANGFITFYLDGDSKQGILHTSFKADRDGESMYLSQKVGGTVTVYDSVSFALLVEDHSFGKYADGTGKWQHMVNMTPGLPNDPDRLVYQQDISRPVYDITIYPNPSAGIVSVAVNEADLLSQVYSLDVIDISGKIIHPKVWLNSCMSQINLTHINNGLYLIRIFKNNQLIHADKLMIIR